MITLIETGRKCLGCDLIKPLSEFLCKDRCKACRIRNVKHRTRSGGQGVTCLKPKPKKDFPSHHRFVVPLQPSTCSRFYGHRGAHRDRCGREWA